MVFKSIFYMNHLSEKQWVQINPVILAYILVYQKYVLNLICSVVQDHAVKNNLNLCEICNYFTTNFAFTVLFILLLNLSR